MTVLGLDLASGTAGYCNNGTCGTITPKGGLHARARHIADQIEPMLNAAHLVVVEDIATRFVQTAIAMGAVHALVFDRLHNRIGPRVVKVAPNVLKKFATGRGNADKDRMLVAALKAGSPAETNDEADAWWLWTLGEALEGRWHVDDTQYRTELVEGLS